MSLSHAKLFSFLALFVLAIAVGCGGDSEPAGDETGAESPTEPGDAPMPSVPQDAGLAAKVQFDTNHGSFVVKLHGERVPGTVENFLKYVDSGFYDGTIFHEVHPDIVVYGGGYTEDLVEKKAGDPITNESYKAASNLRGTIAMVREPRRVDSARCQFFINLVDNPRLDYVPPNPDQAHLSETAGHCVFGEVDPAGLPLLDEIARRQVGNQGEMINVPVTPVVITRVQRL